MGKEYVGPGKPPSQKDEKGKTKKQDELKQIKIEKQELADEKQKFEEERDKFEQKLGKGDKTMEQQEVERELKDLKGNVEKLASSVGEIVAIEKERQRQDAERRSREKEEKRLKSIVETLESGLKDVKETVKGVKDDFKKFCAMNPEDPLCKNFTDQVSQRIKETLKPKEERPKKKEEKKPESKPPESQIISDKDRKRMAEADKWLNFAEPLRGKRPERVTTAVVTAAKNVFNEVAKSEPNSVPELAQSISPEIIQEIRKGLVDPKSMSDKDVAELGIQRCQGDNPPAYCKIWKEAGFNIQEKKKGGMPGSTSWRDIVWFVGYL